MWGNLRCLLLHRRPVPNAPSSAADTKVVNPGGGYFGGLQSRGPQGQRHKGIFLGPHKKVILEGPNGQDVDFSAIAKSVYDMWVALKHAQSW